MTSKLLAMIKLDLLSMRTLTRSLVGLIVVALLVGTVFRSPEVGMPILGVGLMMMPIQLFTADEMYRLRQLYGELPLRRSDVINSRYLLAVAAVVLMVLAGYLMMGVTGFTDDPLMPLTPLWIGISLSLFPTFQIPLLVKYGPTKAVVTGFIVLLVAVSPATVIFTEDEPSVLLLQFLQTLTHHAVTVTAIAAAVAATAMTVSWRITQRIYAKQDH